VTSQETTSFLAGEEAARQLPSNIFILGLVAANKLNLGGKWVYHITVVQLNHF